jgi:DNA modification methylase
MGSGTTAIVSEKLNRRWVGTEIDKEYCTIANTRLSNISIELPLFE